VLSASLSRSATPESTGEVRDDVTDEVMWRPKLHGSPHKGTASHDTSICCWYAAMSRYAASCNT
jgi:hypothetical protein